MWGALRADLESNEDEAGRWAVRLIRAGNQSFGPFRKCCTLLLRVLCGLDFPLSVHPGPGLRLPHGSRGSVLHPKTKIGERVTIYHGVTIGVAGKGRMGVPVIEDDVYLGAGCCILGDVTVGAGAVVGANAVVTSDVRAGATVVGAPAREVNVSV